ncbi:orotidine 5'-phosphate decarboxylase [Bifidobacterium actinocoloniiforme DSM 22766]|uniref:Orotidine 5'-phosphate decarboxylase n=1 Tax=Bifidobacterium actinocoloniiforme DSM 22766 TaxID=1437605 RepID=A0A086Z0K4_9BIFI|nr:orotidine-5'-phosphate decarboxylase [Bifidobacterium actinocoloniiforme]AKV55276.1 orotidine 5'-phosphate decarboxylase [Bifidobacterium actinocoloniiforme DSM 22766]KFI40054.1 orotidine 5'-phosphate decarboxylase [Bifidobacterium actinocoloniiforme DSM 22766]
MDRLAAAIAGKEGNPSLVGLDPRPALLPDQLIRQAVETTRAKSGIPDLTPAGVDDLEPDDRRRLDESWAYELAQAYVRFNLSVLDAVADLVPAVKPQIAMYEALGAPGIEAYLSTCRAARERGLYVIGDVKRGDIGSTASAYACHLSGLPLTWGQACLQVEAGTDPAHREAPAPSPWQEDAITVNPYLGSDGIEPFVQAAQAHDKDIFVLVRTSNPSSSQIQELPLADGQEGRNLCQRVGELVEEWGASSVGSCGYSRIGAVVGATQPQVGALLRQAMPHTFFLLPGYGAQGGTAKDAAAMFGPDGSGAIVNSSRGIIGAWKRSGSWSPSLSLEVALGLVSSEARKAAVTMKTELTQAVKETK